MTRFREGAPPELAAPGWTLLLPLGTLVAMLSSPPERRMWVAPLATLLYVAMQWLLPRCRFRQDNYLGPVNVALTLMLLKLVLVPSLIMLTGAESRVLSYLPSISSMQNSILIDMAAYAALCVGLSHGPRPDRHRGTIFPVAFADTGPGQLIALMYLALGFVGFMAAFGSPARLMAYFLDPHAELTNELESTVTALAGTLFRPFFAFALVAWWTRKADALGSGANIAWVTLAGLIAAAGVTIANMTFSFNRAAFVFPLVSLFAVYSSRVRRIPPAFTLMLIAVALPVLMAVGTVRSSRMEGGDRRSAETPFATVMSDASETLQAYAGGPQYSALFCERTGWGEKLYGGSSLVASALSPVPVLGKGFRETSGPALFNRALYDVRDIEDQIIPFATELFVNFHLPGVMVGFLALGLLLSSAQQWYASAGSAFAAYSIQYVFMWAALLASWSVAIYAQILVYFFGPIYLYIAISYSVEWLRGLYSCRRPDALAAEAAR